MTKLNDEEIMLLSAMLATKKVDMRNSLDDTCQQVQTDYLRIRQTFKDLNKVDISLSSILNNKR